MSLPSSFAQDFFKLPTPDAQKHWEEEFKIMSKHTQKKDAEALIKQRRPNEPTDVHKYRMDNFEHITSQAILRSINNLQRYFSQSKATIKTDAETKEFLKDGDFGGTDWNTYLNQKVINRMIDDPNGRLVWWVGGEGVKDPTKKVEPRPILVLSSEIKHENRNYFSFKSHEKSIVVSNKKEVEEGEIYFVVAKDGYYKYIQIGEQGKRKFVLKKFYKQEFEKLPVVTLGGETTSKIEGVKEVTYLTSYFGGFVPFANEALRQFSDHQAMMITAGHPIREMEGIACLDCQGKGHVRGEGKNANSKTTCKTCQGSKLRIPDSPYGVVLRPPSNRNSLNDTAVETRDAVKYITPPVDILKYAGEHWKDLLYMAENSLNLNYIADAGASGKSKELDRENLIAMLDRIGQNIYLNICRNSIIAIKTVRTRGKDTLVEMIMPNSFKIRSETDLVDELNSLIEKNSPLPLVLEVYKELTRKRYAGDEVVIRATDILCDYDPFFVLPLDKRTEMYGAGALLYEEYRKSLFSYGAIMQVARQNGEDFVTMEYDAVIKQADKIIAPKIQTQIIPGGTGGGDS